MLFSVVVLALRYWVLPGVSQYKADIEQRVSAATGMRLQAESMDGDWQGLRPALDFRNVKLTSPRGGETGLELQSLHASLSWWAMLTGEIRFHEVVLEGPSLVLRRGPDGLIRFNGMPLNKQSDEPAGDLVPWLLRQPQLAVLDARLEWHDDLTAAPELTVSRVDLRIERSGTRHRIGIKARPEAALAREVEARALLTITRPADRWQIEGTVYAELRQAHLAEFRRHFPFPDGVRDATGNVRAWLELDDKAPAKIKAIVADVNAIKVSAQWSKETAPLELATLAGRMEYASLPGGFQISSKGLQLRTRDGVTVPPMDFSLMLAESRSESRRGAITGSAIDLRVMSALLHYFPVGRELRERVARLAPRGKLHEAGVNWTGAADKPATYRIKAKFEGLSLEAEQSLPGVSGLSGSIDGDDKGGRFTLDSPGLKLDLPKVFRDPLHFDVVRMSGAWKRDISAATPAMGITLESSTIENKDFAGEISGSWQQGGQGPGIADLKARFSRAEVGRLAAYLPNQIPVTRSWVEKAIPTGRAHDAVIELSGDLYDFPFKGGAAGRFLVAAQVADARLRFHENWPLIDNINARFKLEGTAITVESQSAIIFQSKLGPTKVEIDDVGSWVPMLKVQGTASASAPDVARYLKESPLREGPGKVTQVLGFEGSIGKLDLSLLVPLGKAYQDGKPAPLPKVSGSYALNGVTVQPRVGQAITEVTGLVQFTERSITGKDLKGKAFGHPLTAMLSSSPETGVVTDLAGRADITATNDYLPFRLPREVSGVTDWKGRISALDGVVDMRFTSALAGVASKLPRPFTKGETDAMDLAVQISKLGTNQERIEVSLANILQGAIVRRFDGADGGPRLQGGIISIGEPVGARPIPEGMWLTGKLPEFDLDQWRAVLTPIAAGNGSANSAEPAVWTGFDLTADKLVAYGRDVAQANVKGRRAGEDWRLTIASREVSGDATWRPGAAVGRGLVRARLSNLVLNRQTSRNAEGESHAAAEIEYPAMDITADSFTFHGYSLGKLALRASHDQRDWRIEQLRIEGDGATLEGTGRWLREGGSRSEFQGKLDARNLNGLLRIFGQADAIRRGTGNAEATLSWPGSPIDFTFTRLSGDLKVDARRGEFAKIQPGAGRLLGLISLQSIPRRFTLDFRDVFSEGFAFDRMNGTFKIQQGVMRTADYEIAGPSAFVTMQGEISLPMETQNLKVTVVPALGEGVSVITTLLGGPIVGLTTLLAQKLLSDPVGRAFGYEYNVTGKWENPDVARVGAPPAPPAAAAQTPAPAPAAPNKK